MVVAAASANTNTTDPVPGPAAPPGGEAAAPQTLASVAPAMSYEEETGDIEIPRLHRPRAESLVPEGVQQHLQAHFKIPDSRFTTARGCCEWRVSTLDFI